MQAQFRSVQFRALVPTGRTQPGTQAQPPGPEGAARAQGPGWRCFDICSRRCSAERNVPRASALATSMRCCLPVGGTSRKMPLEFGAGLEERCPVFRSSINTRLRATPSARLCLTPGVRIKDVLGQVCFRLRFCPLGNSRKRRPTAGIPCSAGQGCRRPEPLELVLALQPRMTPNRSWSWVLGEPKSRTARRGGLPPGPTRAQPARAGESRVELGAATGRSAPGAARKRGVDRLRICVSGSTSRPN